MSTCGVICNIVYRNRFCSLIIIIIIAIRYQRIFRLATIVINPCQAGNTGKRIFNIIFSIGFGHIRCQCRTINAHGKNPCCQDSRFTTASATAAAYMAIVMALG